MTQTQIITIVLDFPIQPPESFPGIPHGFGQRLRIIKPFAIRHPLFVCGVKWRCPQCVFKRAVCWIDCRDCGLTLVCFLLRRRTWHFVPFTDASAMSSSEETMTGYVTGEKSSSSASGHVTGEKSSSSASGHAHWPSHGLPTDPRSRVSARSDLCHF